MPTFAQMLQANPHGWGMGPASPEEGVPGIPDLSGAPTFGRQGFASGLKRFAIENGPDAAMLAAGPAGRLAGAAGEALGPTLSAALLAGGAAGTGLTAGASEAGAPSEDERAIQKGLLEQRAALFQQQQEALARREVQRQSGIGPQFQAADAEAKSLQAKLEALDAQIKDHSPQASFERELTQRKEMNDQPFATRHPNVATGLAVGAPIVAGTLAAGSMAKLGAQGKSLMGEFLQARDAGDVTRMLDKIGELKQYKRWLWPKQAAAVAVPATAPVDARVYGDVVDKYSLPEDSKAQQQASARLSDLPQYLRNSEQAAASGLVSSMLGGKIGSMAVGAPRGAASMVGKRYGGKDASTLAGMLQNEADLSTGLQSPLQRFSTAKQLRAGGSLPVEQLQAGNQEAQRRISAPESGPRVWNAGTQRWHSANGRMLEGGPGPNDNGAK